MNKYPVEYIECTRQLAKMSIDPKFVELKADVVKIVFENTFVVRID